MAEPKKSKFLSVFPGHIRRLPGVKKSGLLGAMRSVDLQEIVRYCDRVLRTREIGDYSGAVNGLQVENPGKVTRIAAAVRLRRATTLSVKQIADRVHLGTSQTANKRLHQAMTTVPAIERSPERITNESLV